MKKLTLLSLCLSLSACTTTHNTASTVSAAKLGTITEKETIVNQVTHKRSPVDIGIGLGGGGHIGWAVNLGLNQLLGLIQTNTTETSYQYTIKLNDSETLKLQSSQDFALNSCVTIWQPTNNSNYPKLETNPTCQLPINLK